jgi:hypothetical protein
MMRQQANGEFRIPRASFPLIPYTAAGCDQHENHTDRVQV